MACSMLQLSGTTHSAAAARGPPSLGFPAVNTIENCAGTIRHATARSEQRSGSRRMLVGTAGVSELQSQLHHRRSSCRTGASATEAAASALSEGDTAVPNDHGDEIDVSDRLSAPPAATELAAEGAGQSSATAPAPEAATSPASETDAAESLQQSPSRKDGKTFRAASDRSIEQQRSDGPEPIPIPPEEMWFKRGDVIPCRVIWANSRGARLATLRDERIVAYMPAPEGPARMLMSTSDKDPPRPSQHDWNTPILPIGTVREVQVLKMPPNLAYYGKGPLVSARLVDLDIMWTRAEQIADMCRNEKETLKVQFTSVNEGGMMSRLMGLRLFMPLSHIAKDDKSTFLTEQELVERYVNNGPTEVAIVEADVYNRRFVCSELMGRENKIVRSITTESLIWGTVRRVENFGVFVGIDGTRLSGLLHVSNISRQHVDYTDDVFEVGDRVRAVVLDYEEDFSRMSLSTAELEENAGDMLVDKDKVYENAEEQVKIYIELKNKYNEEEEEEYLAASAAGNTAELLSSGHF